MNIPALTKMDQSGFHSVLAQWRFSPTATGECFIKDTPGLSPPVYQGFLSWNALPCVWAGNIWAGLGVVPSPTWFPQATCCRHLSPVVTSFMN